MDEEELNLRAIFFIGIFACAIIFFIYSISTETPAGYYKDFSGNNIKVPEGFIANESGYPVPLTYPTPVYINNTIYVTPTPDNGVYYASENENGTRKLQRYFVFHRNDVMGLKDLDFRVTVYGYKMLDSYHWFNYDDSKYYETIPFSNEYKYLFIFVQTYTDTITGDDVRSYIPDEQHFQVKYNDKYYQPAYWEKTIRVYELENIFNYNDDSRIQYYGQFRKQERASGIITSEKQYTLKGGKSNAIDGFIVYEIPKEAEPNNIEVYGEFFSYGSSTWKLSI